MVATGNGGRGASLTRGGLFNCPRKVTMGKFSTVVNETTSGIFSISTIPINRVQNIPGLEEPLPHILYQSAIYKGKTNPLATMLGKKPFVVVSKGNIGDSGKVSVDNYHKYLCDLLENVPIESVDQLITFLQTDGTNVNSVWHGRAPQLLYGLRSVDFITIF